MLSFAILSLSFLYVGVLNNGRDTLLHSSGLKDMPFGKIGVHPHTALLLTASTSLAPALDRQNKTS
jgi:hypothetical protein